jgi:hypothetical protein
MPEVKLPLSGKLQPRPGRQMSHLAALAPDIDTAERLVRAALGALVHAGS